MKGSHIIYGSKNRPPYQAHPLSACTRTHLPYAEKSIKDITVKELCESVDINRGTFYLHYKDIYDMLEQTEQELLEQFEQVFKNYHPDHTPDFPYPLFVEIFQIIDQNSNLCCALLSPNGDISFSVKIKKLFEHQYIHEWMVAHHQLIFCQLMNISAIFSFPAVPV